MPQPDYRSIAGKPTWSELLASDLYSWFNLSGSGRSSVGPGVARAELRPGGAQQFIDLSVLVEGEEAVVGASLALDRSWLDGDRTALANGGDLTKGLLGWLGTADGALPEVARQLEERVLGAAGTIVRGPRPPAAPADPQVAPLLEAFVNAGAASGGEEVAFLGQRLLRAANRERPTGHWFQLDWGECARRPGEVTRWSCDTCEIALLGEQVAEDPMSGRPMHWVWVPGGRVGHPTSPFVSG